MIHVAYITAEYPHISLPPAGGIGSFTKLMATSLLENGCQVTVFLCLSNQNKVWYDEGIRIVELKGLAPSRWSPFINRIKIARTIKNHITKDGIDIVEAPDWEGIHAFCDFKIPLVTRIHGSVTYFNNMQGFKKTRVLTYLEKRAIQNSNKVIAVSNFSGQLTGKVFSFKDFSFETIYNGIDTKAFRPSSEKPTNDAGILYFGTLVRKKGVIALAHIFNELHSLNPHTQLTLIGKDVVDSYKGSSTWELIKTKLTPSALGKVHYKGVMPYQEMSNEISKSEICVFPSFAEAFPISWLEAMAMEKPLVCSSIGWANETIEDRQSGLLEHPKNYKEFAHKINSLLIDKKAATQLGKNARKRVITLFDQSKLVKENIEMYKGILRDE